MSLFDLASQAQRSGRFNEAEELYRRIVSGEPRNFDALHMLGIVCSVNGKDADAERYFLAALAVDSRFPPCHHNFGLFLAKLGRFAEAVLRFDKALALFPKYAQAHSDRGAALMQLGRLDEALASHDRAIAMAPSTPSFWNNRGLLHARRCDQEAALKDFDRAIGLNGNHAAAWVGRGGALFELGRYDASLAAYGKAAELGPRLAEARHGLGKTLAKLERYPQALAAYDEALRLRPGSAESITGRAHVLTELKRFDEAVRGYEKAIAINPDLAFAWHGLANSLVELERFDEARLAYERALKIDPHFAGAWNGIAMLHWAADRHEEALAAYDKAIELEPDNAGVRFNKAASLLFLGRFADGCALYEWRERAGKTKTRAYQEPRWNGGKISGSLLIWGEQGVGDHIVYASMVPELADCADELLVETDERLVPLFARSFPRAKIVAMKEALYSGRIDFHSPMGSALQYLRPDMDAFPKRDRGYLVPDQERVARLRERFGGRPLIGLSWLSRNEKLSHHKSAELRDFEPLLRLPGVCFVDLQYGDTSEERLRVANELGVRVERLEDIDNMNDLDGLAALTAACDRVLTVSNTTAHLAGAVGTPTWVMVPPAAGRLWYWFANRPESPWYPRLRVCRRGRNHSWKQLIASLSAEIGASLAVPEVENERPAPPRFRA